MSDEWGTTEQSTVGNGPVGGKIDINVPGLEKLPNLISSLDQSLQGLKSTLSSFGQQQHQLSQGVAGTLGNVQTSALGATDSIKTFFQSLTGARPGASSMATILDYGLSTGLPQDLAMFPLRYMQSTIGQNRQFALNVGGALAAQQYATGIRTTNLGRPGSGTMGLFSMIGQAFGGNTPGLPTGTGEEIAQFLNIARQAGAMMDLTRFDQRQNYIAGGNLRTPGFMQGAYEMQQMNPNMPLGQIGATLGGFVANTAAQRQAAYLTGGAFSMIKAGGQIKSVSEWSETILRWLENQRPGQKRGTGFTYDELITQQYPGSNMDAWFDANGVPPEMQEQFWNYALAKARTTTTTTGSPMDVVSGLPQGAQNPALQRLRSTAPLTRTSFGLAGRLAGQYAQREDVNREFNTQMSGLLQTIIPAALRGPLGFTKNIPDPIEELLMTMLERLPILGPALGGLVGWGSLGAAGGAGLMEGLLSETGPIFGGLLDALKAQGSDFAEDFRNMITKLMGLMTAGGEGLTGTFQSMTSSNALPDWLSGIWGGDYGDAGDWSMGATTPASLHPSMNRKVSAMMRANPRLRLNSGRRDEVTQRRLKGKGYSRVSGKSSAHTRGLAADLGPRSEYPWIVANARKFGLKSGVGVGEPWHVGLPGIGDIDLGEDQNSAVDTNNSSTNTNTSTSTGGVSYTSYTGPMGLGALLSLFGGGEANIGSAMGGLMNFLFGNFASADVAGASLTDVDKAMEYDPTFAQKMFAAGTYKTGGQYVAGSIIDAVAQAIRNQIAAASGASTAANAALAASNATDLAGALAAVGLASTGLSSGAMVARLADYVGFKGEGLIDLVAISKRESGWDPKAFNGNTSTGDKSYGLMQINMLGALGPERRQRWNLTSDEQLWDPLINLRAAFDLSSSGTDFYHWGGYKGEEDTYNTDRNAALGAIKEAGLGDTDVGYVPPSTASFGRGSATVQFNNTFVIQGASGNGGIDTRRIVTMVADQLESEMRRRMARSN